MKKTTLAKTLLLPAMVLTLTACSTYLAVDEQQSEAWTNAVFSGTVRSEKASEGPVIIGLIDTSADTPYLVDSFVSTNPGRWIFMANPSTYTFVAFVDLNQNGQYDDEPALPLKSAPTVRANPGDSLQDLELVIPTDGRFRQPHFDVEALKEAQLSDTQSISLYALCAIGEVTTLEDPRFSRENAEMGMWRFYDALLAHQCGLFFLQPYDPEKIPVLFVHGIQGTPRDFQAIIAQLDTTRYQPWVFFYPSGAKLETASALLLQLVTRLKLDLDFDRLRVIAHSMGGLVARDFVLMASEAAYPGLIDSFTTISSPFGGLDSANLAVEHAPAVVSSWRGLDPKGTFIDNLFYLEENGTHTRRTLPDSIDYHLLFGYGGRSGDGVIPIRSALSYPAQQEAESIRGYDEDHASILSAPDAIRHIHEILDK